MTSVTTRRGHRGPLKDRTNVLNMKGGKNSKNDDGKKQEIANKVLNCVVTRSRNNAEKEKEPDSTPTKAKQGKKLLKKPQNISSTKAGSYEKPAKCLKVVLTDVLNPQNKSLSPQTNQINSYQKKCNGGLKHKDTNASKEKNSNPSEVNFNKHLVIMLTDSNAVLKKISRQTRSKSICAERPNLISKVQPKRPLRNRSKSLFSEKDTSKKGKEEGDFINCFSSSSRENIDLNTSENNPNSMRVEIGKKMHYLRRLEPKHYLEESSINNEGVPRKTPEVILAKGGPNKNKLPIYKQFNSKEMGTNKQKEDEYEFDDFSPKSKAVKKRIDRSSILFDKDMYEIVKKLEGKEAKAKKRVIKRKKKVASESKKPYEKIVKDIISNIKGKILERNGNNIENPPQPEVTSNITNRKNMQVVNVMVHQEPQEKIVPEVKTNNVPLVQEKSVFITNIATRKPIVSTNLNNIELFLDERGASPINDDISVCSEPPGIEECFGFEFDANIPYLANLNPQKKINILSHQVINSPVNFAVRRPNFNSTMIDFGRSSSPWRTDALHITRNPHFVSVKSNGLPRLDQEMVLESTFVEDFESHCIKTPSKEVDVSSTKKAPVQQSILNYIESNVEHVEPVLERSLFDYEEFNSPLKKKVKEKENKKANQVKRNILLGDKDEGVIASTPIQRRKVLGDISNSPEVENNASNMTYFGFDDSSGTTVEKSAKKASKPSRFDPAKFRSYTSKKNKQQRKIEEKEEALPNNNADESISLIETSDEMHGVHLFEEREEILDNMSPVIGEKKKRRRRLDSYDSNNSDCGKKPKKHKKTKLEIEQERWISEFNQMCEETDQHELELV